MSDVTTEPLFWCDCCREAATHNDIGPSGTDHGPCCGRRDCCATSEPLDLECGWRRVAARATPYERAPKVKP